MPPPMLKCLPKLPNHKLLDHIRKKEKKPQ